MSLTVTALGFIVIIISSSQHREWVAASRLAGFEPCIDCFS